MNILDIGTNIGNHTVSSPAMDEGGDSGVRTLDEMTLPAVDFMKADVEGVSWKC